MTPGLRLVVAAKATGQACAETAAGLGTAAWRRESAAGQGRAPAAVWRDRFRVVRDRSLNLLHPDFERIAQHDDEALQALPGWRS